MFFRSRIGADTMTGAKVSIEANTSTPPPRVSGSWRGAGQGKYRQRNLLTVLEIRLTETTARITELIPSSPPADVMSCPDRMRRLSAITQGHWLIHGDGGRHRSIEPWVWCRHGTNLPADIVVGSVHLQPGLLAGGVRVNAKRPQENSVTAPGRNRASISSRSPGRHHWRPVRNQVKR
jgi:hypothetical protein